MGTSWGHQDVFWGRIHDVILLSWLILNAFRSGIFPIKEAKGKGLKVLTPKQILQRLPIALAQVKVGNTSENLSNKIRQIIYSLYQAKEITKKVYNNIMNSIKV